MTVRLAPVPLFGFGVPAVGALLDTYAAGTTTPLATYTDSTGGTPNANPVVMDASGLASVWLTEGVGYKFRLRSAAGATLWTVDNILVPTVATSSQILPAPGVFSLLTGTFTATSFAGTGAIPLTNFFSVDQLVLMVKLEVTQAFGTSNGLVTLALGDAVTLDRFGGGLSRTTGVKAKSQGGLPLYQTGTTLWLFSEGGTFDTAGVALVSALILTMP